MSLRLLFQGNQSCLQVALITGGTQGKGFEIAKALAYTKARVLILARDVDRPDIALLQIKRYCRVHEKFAPDMKFIECDLARLSDVRRVGDELCEQESRLDLVCYLCLLTSLPNLTPCTLPGGVRRWGRHTSFRCLRGRHRSPLRHHPPRPLSPHQPPPPSPPPHRINTASSPFTINLAHAFPNVHPHPCPADSTDSLSHLNIPCRRLALRPVLL